MKKISIILFSALFFILSCSKKSGDKNENEIRTYDKEGISFSLPVGWNVKQDFTNKTGRYLELDKFYNDRVESTMGISIFKNKPSSDSILMDQVKQLEFFYQKVYFKVLENSQKSNLGEYEAMLTTYEADDTQSKVYGKIYVFQDKENTVSVQIVDHENNPDKPDYNIMFKGFTIK